LSTTIGRIIRFQENAGIQEVISTILPNDDAQNARPWVLHTWQPHNTGLAIPGETFTNDDAEMGNIVGFLTYSANQKIGRRLFDWGGTLQFHADTFSLAAFPRQARPGTPTTEIGASAYPSLAGERWSPAGLTLNYAAVPAAGIVNIGRVPDWATKIQLLSNAPSVGVVPANLQLRIMDFTALAVLFAWTGDQFNAGPQNLGRNTNGCEVLVVNNGAVAVGMTAVLA
jgi:hypothetical protein